MKFRNQKGLPRHQAGQAVLIVLLSLSVVLIVILYILSRSITDISLSSKEEDSLRAFSAAEAGIERALVIGSNISSTELNDATFNATVTGFAQGASSAVFPIPLKSGESALFWFIGHNADGTLGCPASDQCFGGNQIKLCWGDDQTPLNSQTPAVEVTVYYKEGTDYKVKRVAIDPYAGHSNNFSVASNSDCNVPSSTETFQFQNTISFGPAGLNIPNFGTAGVLQYATARILYNTTTAHKIAIDVSGAGGSLLPSQGVKVNSNGSFADSNRSIEVYQLHPETPPVFVNVLYSGSGIIK